MTTSINITAEEIGKLVLNKFSKNTKEIKECKYFNRPKGCNNIKCQFRHIKNDILIKIFIGNSSH